MYGLRAVTAVVVLAGLLSLVRSYRAARGASASPDRAGPPPDRSFLRAVFPWIVFIAPTASWVLVGDAMPLEDGRRAWAWVLEWGDPRAALPFLIAWILAEYARRMEWAIRVRAHGSQPDFSSD